MELADNLRKIANTSETLQLFRALVDQLNDGVFVVDPKTSRFKDGSAFPVEVNVRHASYDK